MPAPYRRACSNCVKSKRRCNLAVPSCYRCRVRSLSCQYQQTHTAATPAEVVLLSLPVEDPFNPPSAELGSLARDDQVAEENIDATMNNWLTEYTSSLHPFPDYNLDWTEIMQDIDVYRVPDRIGRGNSPENTVLSGEIFQERIVNSVKRLKTYPDVFVREGKTPFIHPALYHDHFPGPIQDALLVCALYKQKNEANEAWVFRVINTKTASLLDRPAVTLSQQPVLEQLAAVQALILYQIIRLFDGDIRQRAEAERTDQTMTTWTKQLQLHMNPVESNLQVESGLAVDKANSGRWKSWLLDETVRRTVIICYTLQGMYCFLKNGWDNSHTEFNYLSFYAQQALWGAASDYQWQTALQSCPSLPVRFPSWDTDLRDVRPSDVDDLGMMMMVLMKGVDFCMRWAGQQYCRQLGLEL
ncbi:hypothetical protein FE257_007047 [Aspergillus nanangensis]|uniref:Zn(2)-C6 fungal-type domain-containing protein n=1 Tax=Aspergillus nanangensis TaxID=2582783 RepID=A0AAD4CNH7_ASPNN|nr:hypothetical protein FE257_007047 [Aspergillus nanangensis]